MTTKNSPISRLRKQADNIAHLLLAAERGEKINTQFAEKVEAARGKPSINIAVVMDDKIISLDLKWEVIRSSGQAGLSEYILGLMKEERRALND